MTDIYWLVRNPLFSVAINLDFFSICKPEAMRVHVFEDFVNQVLKENAEGYERPPKTYSEAMETARIVCNRYKQPCMPPCDFNYYAGAGVFGGDHGGAGNGSGGGGGRGGGRGGGSRGGRGGGRAGGMAGGRGGMGGGGAGVGGGFAGAPREVNGKLPVSNKNLMHNGERVCRAFNDRKCTRSSYCTSKDGTKYQHWCGTVVGTSKNGNVLLCGSNRHSHHNCPKKT